MEVHSSSKRRTCTLCSKDIELGTPYAITRVAPDRYVPVCLECAIALRGRSEKTEPQPGKNG